MAKRLERDLGERGAGLVEYVGMVVCVALIAVGAAMTISPKPVADAFLDALCQAYSKVSGLDLGCAGASSGSDGSGPAEKPKTDEDYKPGTLMTGQSSDQVSASVTIAFVKIGEDSGFVVQEYNMPPNDTDHSDDVVRVTLTDGATVGLTGGTPSAQLGESKIGVDVSLGADLSFKYGSTWEFSGVDDEGRTAAEQWDAMEADLNAYLVQWEALKSDPSVSWWYVINPDAWVDPPKDPTYVVSEIGFTASFSIGAAVKLPTGDSVDSDQFFKPGVGIGFKGTATENVATKTNLETGDVSTTWSIKGSAAGSVDLAVWGADPSASREGAFTVTQDADGNLKSLTFSTTTENWTVGTHTGGSPSNEQGGVGAENADSETYPSVVTTTLDVTKLTDSEKSIVAQWVADQVRPEVGIAFGSDVIIPTSPSSDPFQNIMYNNAITSIVDYDKVSDKTSFEASIKLGWKFGIAFSMEDLQTTATSVEYLGLPDGVNPRPVVSCPECVG